MIIGIDTSTPSVSVALADESGLVASLRVLRGRRHVETLIPAIEQLLSHAECTYADITGIAIDRGPGLFTGLRVGVATAKALAMSLSVPVFAATSLDVLAHQWAYAYAVHPSGLRGGTNPDTEILAVIDARRQEVYAQRFTVAGGGVTAVGEPRCVSPTEATEVLGASEAVRVVGDAAVGLSAFTPYPVSPGSPEATTLVAMVPDLAATHPDDVELLYLRAPDAEINWTSRP